MLERRDNMHAGKLTTYSVLTARVSLTPSYHRGLVSWSQRQIAVKHRDSIRVVGTRPVLVE